MRKMMKIGSLCTENAGFQSGFLRTVYTKTIY